MAGRQTTLHRMAELYKTMEALRSSELQRAQAMVWQAEQEIVAQLALRCRTMVEGRSALEQADDLGWRSSQAQASLTERRCEGLEAIRVQRGTMRDAATEIYQTSRVQSEQMVQLLEDSISEANMLENRRMQAESDDRHLSRRRWSEANLKGRESKL
jgi:hypothetical protein